MTRLRDASPGAIVAAFGKDSELAHDTLGALAAAHTSTSRAADALAVRRAYVALVAQAFVGAPPILTGEQAWLDDPRTRPFVRDVFARLTSMRAAFALPDLAHDVLGPIHHQLVDRDERHVLGEHYTPSWLARDVVTEAFARGRSIGRVLDPACGSGAMLRAVIAAIAPDELGPGRAQRIADRIVGHDIDPLAAIVARANVSLALQSIEPGATPNLHVFEGDALEARIPGRFDMVVGNPPWVSLRMLDRASQAKLIALADRYALGAKGRLRTQLDMATIFLLVATDRWLRDDGTLALVMPRSLLAADQHEAIRRGTHASPCRVEHVWDLERVRPLFPIPACVVFARRALPSDAVPTCTRFEGAPPSPARTDVELHLARLGARTAWHTRASITLGDTQPSIYLDRFRQGATLVPRNFYFVTLDETRAPSGMVHIRTDERQREGAKPPYRDERLAGPVEPQFLFRALLSRHVFPFAVRGISRVVLPIEIHGDRLRMLDVETLHAIGAPAMAAWMTDVEARFHRLRAGKADLQTALARLDYHRELSRQDPRARHLVVYNTSGTHLAAAAIHLGDERPPVIDAKCYACVTETGAEADYLAGVLNASITDTIVKPFQSVGLQGARDLHTKVLSLPIPRFDPNDALHVTIAETSARLARMALLVLEEIPDTMALGHARVLVRRGLGAERAPLEHSVRTLFSC